MPSGTSLEAFSNKTASFAANAWFGIGGQGEFLRQMVFALDQLPHGRVFSRYSVAERAECVQVPFAGFRHRLLFDMISNVPLLRARRDWRTLLSDLDFDRRLSNQIEEEDLFDGIMAQCCETFLQLKRGKTVLVLTCLNTHINHLVRTIEAEHERIGFRGYHFVHPRMRQRALMEIELADRIRVNSEWARKTFIEHGVPSEKMHVIHPAIDRKHFYPVEKPDDVFRVMAVSSIDPRKGIYYLLQAFEEARIPNSELVLIGGTGDRWSRKMLEGFLGRNTSIRTCAMDVMTAPVTNSFGAASVVVHPALEDGYGLVIPQALASGRPVIATRQSGASELIQDGKTGFVVEAGSAKEIKERLQLLASDRTLRESMSQAAPDATGHLDYRDFAREVTAFYAELLA